MWILMKLLNDCVSTLQIRDKPTIYQSTDFENCLLLQKDLNMTTEINSFCCSLSGCLPSREAVNSQGAAIGENMFQHFVLLSVAGLFSGRQSLQGSDRYFLLRYLFCCSPSGCLPSREAVNSQGAAVGENMFQHFVLPSVAELFSRERSLQGSGRYFQRYRCKMRRSVPSCGAVQSLKGLDRYSLRHGRRIAPADTSSMSLQGSNRYYPAA